MWLSLYLYEWSSRWELLGVVVIILVRVVESLGATRCGCHYTCTSGRVVGSYSVWLSLYVFILYACDGFSCTCIYTFHTFNADCTVCRLSVVVIRINVA